MSWLWLITLLIRKIKKKVCVFGIIVAALKLPKAVKSVATSFSFRPITKAGVEKFGSMLLNVDWDFIKTGNPTQAAELLNKALQSLVEASFPTKTRNIKSTDAPWFTPKLRRIIARKQKIYTVAT